MSIKNWFTHVQNAFSAEVALTRASEACLKAKNDIHPLWPLDEMPNDELQKNLGVQFCQLTYCPEEPIWGSMFEEDKRSKVCSCTCFDKNTKCPNQGCPAHTANNAYFDAKEKHAEAMTNRKNAWRRVLGIKTK